MITAQQKELVQKTWVMVVPIANKAAELFYGRLFELEPEYKAMFKNDMTENMGQRAILSNILIHHIDSSVFSSHWSTRYTQSRLSICNLFNFIFEIRSSKY